MRCDPIILKSVTGPNGENYEVPNANCEQVMPQEVADRVIDVLRGPFRSGTARAANIPGYSIAGKTGTDTNAPTIWTLGFTPQLATAAMLTVDKRSDRYRSGRTSLEGAPIQNGRVRLRGSSGGEAGRYLWKPTMEVALQHYERGSFVAPTRYTPPQVDVPSCSGLSVQECRQTLSDAGFGTAISRQTNSARAGTLLGISPSTRAPAYSTIRIIVSSGPAAPAAEEPTDQPSEGAPADPGNG